MRNDLTFTVQNLYIETTSCCNLRCKHCYNASGEQREVLPYSLIRSALADARTMGCSYVSLSGGEPLLYPYIWQLTDDLVQQEIPFLLITNGTLLDEKAVARLKNIRCTVQISLDGPDAYSHDAVRGPGVFDRALRNIIALRQSGFAGEIVIKGVLTRHMTQRNIGKYRALAREIGASRVEFGWLERTGRGRDNYEELFVGQENLSEYLTSVGCNVGKDDGVEIADFGYTDSCPLANIEDNSVEISPKITYRGEVFSCQMFVDSVYAIGNLYHCSLAECIHGDRFLKFLDLLALRKDFMPQCRECVYQHHCDRGCPALGVNRGSIFACDEFCPLRKNSYDEQMLRHIHS